jgi:hypothetical protein
MLLRAEDVLALCAVYPCIAAQLTARQQQSKVLTAQARSCGTPRAIISATTSAWPPHAASCSALLAACSSSSMCCIAIGKQVRGQLLLEVRQRYELILSGVVLQIHLN